ncbi:MAG: hypothetical protein ACXAB4_12510, partial [Candidatus Hodarchaeales archaeon]
IFRASEATFDIDFGEEESEEHLERDLFFIAVQVVIWVTFFSIWGVYAVIAYNVFKIATDKGSQPKDQDPATLKKKTGDDFE